MPARHSERNHGLSAVPRVLGLLSLAVLVLASARSGALAAPHMVKDINTTFGDPDYVPTELTALNGTLFFRGRDAVNGSELWKSDGTAAGTLLVKDINPGAGGSDLSFVTSANGTLFLGANDGTHGFELWKSDGTPAGTKLVKDVRPGSAGSFTGFTPRNVDVDGTLFFVADDGVLGVELWKTDGTAAGTVLVKNIAPAGAPSYPHSLTNMNGTLFFVADDGSHGNELWKSDGTEAGTVLVKDIAPGAASGAGELVAVNGTLFFNATDGAIGLELWKSDGTQAGTVLVKDIRPGPSSSLPFLLTNVGGTVFFRAQDATHGIELWKSDGTEAGTVLVKDIRPGASHSSPQNLTNVNGTLFFTAGDESTGVELWKSDGTNAGTVMVKDINPDSGSDPEDLTEAGGRLFFRAWDGVTGYELWTSDGTVAGTTLVRDLCPGWAGSIPEELVDVNGTLFFTANQRGPWKSDGTSAGTVLVRSDGPGGGSGTPTFVSAAGTMLLNADDGLTGAELWKTDGTEAGTGLVKDINTMGDSAPWALTALNGSIYFSAYGDVIGTELFRSDGTEGGTVLVKDIEPDLYSSSDPFDLVDVGGVLFFSASPSATGRELWKSDGTEAGTALVKDINPGAASALYSSMAKAVMNGSLFFTADDGVHGGELWKSNGTEAGTAMVKDLFPGPSISNPSFLTVYRGALFFNADDGIHGQEIWKSDGTAAGTVLLKNINPSVNFPDSSYPYSLKEVNGTLFFVADDGTHGWELWKSDGTEAGTALVKDINPGPAPGFSYMFSLFTDVNGTLFFRASDGTHGNELWKSDGTAAGTQLVEDINPGAPDGIIESFAYSVAGGGTLYFAANDGIDGIELWQSDGTAAGTFEVYDINPGPAGSDPTAFTPACSLLLFSAKSLTSGREPWALPASFGPDAVGDVHVRKNVPGAGLLEVSWSPVSAAFGHEAEYDVARGGLSTLHSSGFPAGAACVGSGIPDSPHVESASACGQGPGDGCWFLVRARSVCGAGTYGAAALDAFAPCP